MEQPIDYKQLSYLVRDKITVRGNDSTSPTGYSERIDPQLLSEYLAKQQEEINVLKESAINSHLENIRNTLAVTENPDQSITYKGDTYHRKITPQEVHKAWKEAKTITESPMAPTTIK